MVTKIDGWAKALDRWMTIWILTCINMWFCAVIYIYIYNYLYIYILYNIFVKQEHELNIDTWNSGLWKEGTVASNGFFLNSCWCGEGINHQHLLPSTYPDRLVFAILFTNLGSEVKQEVNLRWGLNPARNSCKGFIIWFNHNGPLTFMSFWDCASFLQ